MATSSDGAADVPSVPRDLPVNETPRPPDVVPPRDIDTPDAPPGDASADAVVDARDGGCDPEAMVRCYTGAPGTVGVGRCRFGVRPCDTTGTPGSTCIGEVTPVAEICSNGIDDDCDGRLDNGCAACRPGTMRPCYEGPTGTRAVGRCHEGIQTCTTAWGPCVDQALPTTETCNMFDDDCDGLIDEDDRSTDGGLCAGDS